MWICLNRKRKKEHYEGDDDNKNKSSWVENREEIINFLLPPRGQMPGSEKMITNMDREAAKTIRNFRSCVELNF